VRSLRYLFALKESFPPFRVDTTVLFASEMKQRGHRIHWIFESTGETEGNGWQEWAGGKVWVVAIPDGHSLLTRIKRMMMSWMVDLRLLLECRKERWDFIQVRDRFLGGCLGLLAARLGKTQFFFWLSFAYPELYETRVKEGESCFPLLDLLRSIVLKALLYKIICRFADHIFVQSEQMKRDLMSIGVPTGKLTSVPMGISTERVNKFQKMYVPDKGNDKVIVHLGTLVAERKLAFLVRVLEKIKLKRNGVKLCFVGSGSNPGDEDIIIKEAIRLDLLDSIEFTGFLPQEEAWQKVINADVCVSPYYPTPILQSTSPTKLMEYMALGMPVVVTDHPEQRQVIEESGGGLCVSWKEDEVANALIQILDDPDLGRKMGKNGKLYVSESRSYAAIGRELHRAYMRLCKKPIHETSLLD